MSLILEALKKLDREKRSDDRGLVVLGAATWAGRREGRGLRLALLAGGLVLVGLGLGLAGLWLRAPSAAPPPATRAPAPPPPGPLVAPAAGTPAPLPPPIAARAVAAPAATPTAKPAASRPARVPPPVEPGAAPPSFVLQAVTEQDGQPVALIDDQLLHVGEGVNGMRILRITPTEVEIQIEATGERRVLTF